ncbi:Ecl1p NDAI_0D03760 [Naumovozyma dairenensis CBS 421]|uniref:Uncharacterized protein n=1 Tax=Naumovozyma dairenensis (strain ATCC 10597 / BCRC 20456 / CBS 421 / NBRC 0211 / NRRL Y-12639) TaxID=1071378 RepID=G0WA79_NAUDC|nr:hypothetical protein NDAI_0D03760 [Naumovozyma dairenensis CBS 421]CCD24690.1 hypothetical protein NDAI_0D03760 [Naumovozyma dairenensis CBS 421]
MSPFNDYCIVCEKLIVSTPSSFVNQLSNDHGNSNSNNNASSSNSSISLSTLVESERLYCSESCRLKDANAQQQQQRSVLSLPPINNDEISTFALNSANKPNIIINTTENKNTQSNNNIHDNTNIASSNNNGYNNNENGSLSVPTNYTVNTPLNGANLEESDSLITSPLLLPKKITKT